MSSRFSRYSLVLCTFISATTYLSSLDLDELERLLEDPTAFEGMDNQMGMPTQGQGDNDFDMSSFLSFLDEMQPPTTKPVATKQLPSTPTTQNVPQDNRSLFLQSLNDTAPLTVKSKKAAAHFLRTGANILRTLQAHMTSFDLGIAYQEQLRPHVATVNKAIDLCERLNSRSPFIKTLYTKTYDSLRSDIVTLPEKVSKLNTQLQERSSFNDSLDKPSQHKQDQQQATLQEVALFATQTLERMVQELEKVTTDKSTQKGLDQKRKKFEKLEREADQRNKKGSAGSYDRYSMFADYGAPGLGRSGYGEYGGTVSSFSQGWGAAPMQYGGWNDSSGSFWDSFGSKSGGHRNWGGSGRNSFKSYENRVTSDGPSEVTLPQRIISSSRGTPQKEFEEMSFGPPLITDEDLTRAQFPLHLRRQQKRVLPTPEVVAMELDKLSLRFASAQEKGTREKLRFIRKQLASTSFQDIMKNVILLTQKGSHKVIMLALESTLPLIVETAKYALPSAEAKLAEKVLAGKQDVDSTKIIAKVARKNKLRQSSQMTLLSLLKTIRNTGPASLYQKAVKLIKEDEAHTLQRIEEVLERVSETSLPLKELLMLFYLSQRLLKQPVAYAYAQKKDETDKEKEKRNASFESIRTQKSTVSSNIAKLLKQHFSLKKTALQVVDVALESAKTTLSKTGNDKETVSLEPYIRRTLEASSYDTQRVSLTKMLIPFTSRFWEQLKVNIPLLTSLRRHWKKERNTRKKNLLKQVPASIERAIALKKEAIDNSTKPEIVRKSLTAVAATEKDAP